MRIKLKSEAAQNYQPGTAPWYIDPDTGMVDEGVSEFEWKVEETDSGFITVGYYDYDGTFYDLGMERLFNKQDVEILEQ